LQAAKTPAAAFLHVNLFFGAVLCDVFHSQLLYLAAVTSGCQSAVFYTAKK
jgi:hypothetical protein